MKFKLDIPLNLAPQPKEHANFATAARLLSCLVSESLVPAIYRPLHRSKVAGFATIFKGGVSLENSAFDADDILAVVPLHHAPIFKHDGDHRHGHQIALLNPLDMMFAVYETRNPQNEINDRYPTRIDANVIPAISKSLAKFSNHWQIVLYKSTDVLSIWEKIAKSLKLSDSVQRNIKHDLSSSVEWQTHSYENPPQAPLLSSPNILWEQSIIGGHPTHPLHKTRSFLPPIPDYSPGSYDLLHPRLRLVSFPRNHLKIVYNFEELLLPVISAASARAGKELIVQDGHVIVPVHELQVFIIQDKFPEAFIYPEDFSLPLMAQQSLRSVIVPGVYRDLHLKFAVGMKLTASLRTISPKSAQLGPWFSKKVEPFLAIDRSILSVANELASVIHVNPDKYIAQHCSVIIRQGYEDISEDKNDRLIVCTALTESGYAEADGHLPSVIRIFGLDTQAKRLKWLETYISVFLRAFLPPVLHNGLTFECHPQNCVARFDLDSHELKGFIVRDMAGLEVHPETLTKTTGVELDSDNPIVIRDCTLDDVYVQMYQTAIHNHLQQLIRVLELHYNGLGWGILRQQLRKNIPEDHPLYFAWILPDRKTYPGSCHLRRQLLASEWPIYYPFPNIIHYKGCREELDMCELGYISK